MNLDIALRTISPFLILMGLGFVSRMKNFLKEGDDMAFNTFIYYFALPSFLVSSLSAADFTKLGLGFVAACLAPIVFAIILFYVLRILLKLSRGFFTLLVVCTVFGNLFFYGIPFVVFGFPEAISLATVSASFISILAIPSSIAFLELYSVQEDGWRKRLKKAAVNVLKNPVIFSVFLGLFLSVSKIGIPGFILNSLNLIGSTTVPLAIFLLGTFFYGRRFDRLADGFMLSLLRMAFLPTTALLTAELVGLSAMEKTMVVIMHGTPLATPMIVFSERYNFYRDTIASLLLVSSVLGGIYLNIWLLILGY